MKERITLLSILLLMCVLIPLQRATATVSIAVEGLANKLTGLNDTEDITFTIRVTSEDGDDYGDVGTTIRANGATGTIYKIDAPDLFDIKDAGTHDLTITVQRSELTVLEKITIGVEVVDKDNKIPDKLTVTLTLTVLKSLVETAIYVDGYKDEPAIHKLSTDEIGDIFLDVNVTNGNVVDGAPNTASLSLDFTLPTSGTVFDDEFQVNLDTTQISMDPTSVTVAAGESTKVELRIPGRIFSRPGLSTFDGESYFFKIVATPGTGDPTTLDVRINITVPAFVPNVSLEVLDDSTKATTTDDTDDITYTLRVTNTGNVGDGIHFTIFGDIETATVNRSGTQLFRNAYEDITLTIPRTALLSAGTYNVTVTAASEIDPRVTATVTTKTTVTGDTVTVGPGTGDTPTPPEPPPPDLSTHRVVFSEIMFASEGGANGLPQWAEIYNNSTYDINLRGWKLQWKQLKPIPLNVTVPFQQDFIIPSQECRLIVSDLGRHSGGGNLSDDSVYLLATLLASLLADDEEEASDDEEEASDDEEEASDDEEEASDDEEGVPVAQAGIQNYNRLIAQGGFSLKLLNVNGVLVDQVGTLNGNRHAWKLPECLIDGVRSSLIRRFDNKVPRSGTERRAWRRAYDTKRLVSGIYYGNPRDLGTPGYRRGQPLPVELSQFSAKFVNDAVVINWTTESELNNAGFNILRSTSRTENFHPINTKLVQGAGTTGERNTYQFIDKTAKSNVVYYYRLEDVDLSGTRGISTTYRLRGIIAPTGKHITTWGTLKYNN